MSNSRLFFVGGRDPRARSFGGAGVAMQMDDMILVSIDDHMIEPPDMYKNHVPAKWQDQAPKVVRNDAGRRRVGRSRARRPPRRSAWPPPSAGRARSGASTPARSPSCGPGCFDVHERVRDMDANGVLASMSFPTMAGFNARTFTEARRQGARRSSCCRPTTTGPSTSGARAYPGRFIPLGIVPMWDVDLAVAEVHRLAQEGLPLDQLPRDAARAGLPELPVGPLGPDAPGAVATEHGAVAAHRRRLRPHPDGRRRRRSTT